MYQIKLWPRTEKYMFLLFQIVTDFNQRYPEKIDSIYRNWQNVCSSVLQEIKERKINDLCVGETNDKSAQTILLLPYLFNPVTIKKSRKGNAWRPSRTEVQESFFFHLTDLNELEARCIRRKEKLASHSLPLQPFGVILGHLKDPKYIIIIDEVQYTVDNGCQENSVFHCAETNCNRSFPLLKSYRKHLSNHTDSVNNIGTNVKNISTDTKIQPSHNLLAVETAEKRESITIQENSEKSEPNQQNNFLTFKDKLYENNVIFISKLYGEASFSRKDIQKIMNVINNLLFEPMNIFEKSLKQILENHNLKDEIFLINRFFGELNNLFKGFETEYLRFKILEDSKLFIKPISFSVGEGVETKNSILIKKKYTAEFIPLSDVLKCFFSMPGVLNEMINYIEHLKHQESVSNIIQTDFWKSKVSDFKDNALVFPLFIYYDDFESGNPLGSHSGIHKLGAIYCSVACLPPKYRSQLENIFLLTLFHTSDLKEFGPSVIFSPMINELNFLRTEGITVELPRGKSHIYFNTILFLGDNLALDTILGFQESFSANSFCRFCKSLRKETQSATFENEKKMRNRQKKDLVTNYPYLTGVKIDSVLNKIKSFHVTDNFSVDIAHFSVDIAHDILEGVAGVVMARLLNQFIFVEKYMDIEMLNNRIKYFNYGPNHNKPPLISIEYLKKNTLKMSASEMKTFVSNAGLIFAELIPTENRH
ncbi:unnamed protein product [Ceutorhynchus assimilis]|uniref:C2H2-type domain-containing protein n=1 Tax=Ceutorhynchus assimilis TaxID=467358 RepID=A0A9N9MZ86_9CUCU|nr:unnamed protein product [Ceutorhynchus assimilis]